MTPAPADWADDLAIGIMADCYRHPFLMAQRKIAERLRQLRSDENRGHLFPSLSDDDHD